MTYVKKVVIFLVIVNLLAIFLQLPILGAVRGYAKVVLMDHFYDLRLKGIINDRELNRQFGDKIIPTNLNSVTRFFLSDSLDLPVQVGVITTVLYLINVLFLLCVLRALKTRNMIQN